MCYQSYIHPLTGNSTIGRYKTTISVKHNVNLNFEGCILLRFGTVFIVVAIMTPTTSAATEGAKMCTHIASPNPNSSDATKRHPISGQEYPGQSVIDASMNRKLIKIAAIIIPSLIVYLSFIVSSKQHFE